MKIPDPLENVSWSPEKWGLEVVDSIEFTDESYSFDTRIVWKDTETGELWSGRDAGCSCPSPFEEFRTEADFERVTLQWYESQLVPEVTDGAIGTFSDKQQFLDNVRRLIVHT